ncbi:hypothetical protein QR66_09875 [Chromobacterium piscinae]|nr:hypothetical protein QR66_09875 [Chromobacterium piscinae]
MDATNFLRRHARKKCVKFNLQLLCITATKQSGTISPAAMPNQHNAYSPFGIQLKRRTRLN